MIRTKMLILFVINIMLLLYHAGDCDGRTIHFGRNYNQRGKRQDLKVTPEVTTKGKISEVEMASVNMADITTKSAVESKDVTDSPAGISSTTSDTGTEEEKNFEKQLEKMRVGQVEVGSISEFPYVVSISRKESEAEPKRTALCTGLLLSSTTVLTTAKCAKNVSKLEDLEVRLGSLKSNEEGITRNVVNITVHPHYDDKTMSFGSSVHDFALLEMDTPVEEKNGIAFAKIIGPDSSVDALVAAGASCQAAGFGVTPLHRQTAGILRKISVTPLDWNACNSSYENAVQKETQVCVSKGGENNEFCFYDDGSPLSCGDKIYGMFVFSGISENCAAKPTTFVRLDSLTSFIHQPPVEVSKGSVEVSVSPTEAEVSTNNLMIQTQDEADNVTKSFTQTMTSESTVLESLTDNLKGDMPVSISTPVMNATSIPGTTQLKSTPYEAPTAPEGRAVRRQPMCELLRRPPPGIQKPVCKDSSPGCCPMECFKQLRRRGVWRSSRATKLKTFFFHGDSLIFSVILFGMFHISI